MQLAAALHEIPSAQTTWLSMLLDPCPQAFKTALKVFNIPFMVSFNFNFNVVAHLFMEFFANA